MPSSQGPWESCMNSLAPSNLPVSSADIVVGLVGSKVQELPESPEKREKSNKNGWKFQLRNIFYIDLHHHGDSWRMSHSHVLLVEVIMQTKVSIKQNRKQNANSAKFVNPPPLNLNPPQENTSPHCHKMEQLPTFSTFLSKKTTS